MFIYIISVWNVFEMMDGRGLAVHASKRAWPSVEEARKAGEMIAPIYERRYERLWEGAHPCSEIKVQEVIPA